MGCACLRACAQPGVALRCITGTMYRIVQPVAGLRVMTESISELEITQWEDGVEVVKQVAKQVLTQGAWSTIVYQYQEWDAKKNAYSPMRFTIRRYQKRNGLYKQRSKFNISSTDQANKLIDILQQWVKSDTQDVDA